MNKVERPKGCYYHNDDDDNDEDEKLWFNTATENTTPCTDIMQCVCKDGIQTSGKIKQELISNHFPWKLVDHKQR